jgi:hypothetical protein
VRTSSAVLSGVLLGGSLAGALDILYAMGAAALRGRSPVRPVQAVASGLVGSSAFEGGAATLSVGFLSHILFVGLPIAFAVRRVGSTAHREATG